MYLFDIRDMLDMGKIRAKMSAYKTKKQKAIDLCAEKLLSHRAPYVALSGGKDSVAMAYIVNDAAIRTGKDFRLWLHASDASFPGTIETCRDVADKICRPLDISMSKASAFDLLRDTDRKQAFGKTGVFFTEVRRYASDKDLAFVGVRAGESKRRTQAAKAHGQSVYSKSMGNIDVIYPLQWFDIYDVMAALIEYDAPIHPIYYKQSIDPGLTSTKEPRFIRLSYVTGRDLWERGTLTFIKLNYPDLYAKVIDALPDAARYT